MQLGHWHKAQQVRGCPFKAPKLSQAEAGRSVLSTSPCLPCGTGDMGTVGSDRAVLTGHSAGTTTSRQVGCQRSLNLEQLKKAKLHVEMAIKVRDLISHPSNATCLHLLHFWLRRAEPEEPGLGQAEPMVSAQEKKIFMVQGPYPIIRHLLRARGWVERKLPSMGRQLEQHRGDQNKQRLKTKPRNGGGGQGEALLNPCGGAQPLLGTTDPLHYAWPPAEEEEEKEEEQCDEDPNGIHDLMVS